VENTNKYAEYKEAFKGPEAGKKYRWWKVVDFCEMRIFIALIIYIRMIGTSCVERY
jgi:hypothetical protein